MNTVNEQKNADAVVADAAYANACEYGDSRGRHEAARMTIQEKIAAQILAALVTRHGVEFAQDSRCHIVDLASEAREATRVLLAELSYHPE